ncbi:MAG: uracil-DNA glycosylase family protein [Candidatus Dormibacteria bacterium]
MPRGRRRSGGPHHARWIPEPGVGHLTEAPLLFVSSNPAGGGDPITDPQDLSRDWPDEALLDWADGAFDQGQFPGVAEGAYLVDRQGERGKWVHYWGWAQQCAKEILPQLVVPGQGYALTEVVHCGSRSEKGVWAALKTCTSRYLERVLRASPAQVLVVVGAITRSAFESYLHLAAEDHLLGTVEVAGKERLLVVVPHPHSRGGQVPLSRHLEQDQMERLRQAVARWARVPSRGLNKLRRVAAGRCSTLCHWAPPAHPPTYLLRPPLQRGLGSVVAQRLPGAWCSCSSRRSIAVRGTTICRPMRMQGNHQRSAQRHEPDTRGQDRRPQLAADDRAGLQPPHQ